MKPFIILLHKGEEKHLHMSALSIIQANWWDLDSRRLNMAWLFFFFHERGCKFLLQRSLHNADGVHWLSILFRNKTIIIIITTATTTTIKIILKINSMLPLRWNSNTKVLMDGPHICSNKAVCRSLWLFKHTYSVCDRMRNVVHHRF